MNHSDELSPIKLLALARLLVASDKGETEAKLSKDLVPLVRHRWEGREWAEHLGQTLDELESSSLIKSIRKGKTAKLALTEVGKRLALEGLGMVEPPPKFTWAKVKSSALPALALGRRGQAVANLKAEILRHRYGLTLGDPARITEATEAMGSKLLGLEPGQKFNADNILRKMLHDAGIEIAPSKNPTLANIREALFLRELGDPSARKPLDRLVTRSVGARQDNAAELVAAVIRSWVDQSEPVSTTVAAAVETAPGPLELADFARAVITAARESSTGRFGDSKVFIAHVWQGLRDHPGFQGVDPAGFKDRLIEAQAARLIELGRADLVEAMDPVDVSESATPYGHAVYHFIRFDEEDR